MAVALSMNMSHGRFSWPALSRVEVLVLKVCDGRHVFIWLILSSGMYGEWSQEISLKVDVGSESRVGHVDCLLWRISRSIAIWNYGAVALA